MVESLGEVVLKSGERVSAAAIRGPDEDWRPHITRLLQHKGDPWVWQNTELLTHATGVEAWFHVLHRSGVPFAHIMTAEVGGVGIFGHVWTEPADREQGAAGRLMQRQMAHFRQRGGHALFLHTSPDNPAFLVYQRYGFAPIEPKSGVMIYSVGDYGKFEADYFAAGDVTFEPVQWRHWPTAPALFTAAIPGVVRCMPLGLAGRKSSEEALLPWIQGAAEQVLVARKSNGAVVGVAAWSQDEFSADCICVDVFCHPLFWSHGAALLDAVLARAPQRRRIAYGDSDCPAKQAVLIAAGFKPAATWPRRLAADAAATRFVDLVMFEQAISVQQ